MNADVYCDTGASVLGTNMFAYCENNSVNYNDGLGKSPVVITGKLNNLMRKNAVALAKYIISQILFKPRLIAVINIARYFYLNSKSYGAWDLKRKSEWKLKKGDWFVYNGRILREDDPGNIHFGYVGSVLFPVGVLCAGAGIYQIITGTSKWYYFFSYFDDPRDSLMIRYGNSRYRYDIHRAWLYYVKMSRHYYSHIWKDVIWW